MTPRMVVVGSLNLDLVVTAPRHPSVGETLLGTDFRTYCGGKGANQAVAASRLGASVSMVGCVGADTTGDQLVEALSKEGVNTEHVRREPGVPSGVAVITVDSGGKNTIVVVPGANDCVTPAHVSAAGDVFDGAGILLVQLESPMDAVSSAAAFAREHGALVVLNAAPARSLDAELLRSVDYLIVNRSELQRLAECEGLETGVERLRLLGVRHIVVTLGELGVLVTHNKDLVTIPAFKVQAVDTTGAGDAFVAAFAVALLEDRGVLGAATSGNAAGALATTRKGAQSSLPLREELDAFLSHRS